MSKQRAGDGRSDSGGIVIPPAKVRGYLKAHGACCIAVSANNKIMIARDVGRLTHQAIAVWWGQATTVIAIKKHLTSHGGVDVPGAAAALRLSITPHVVVVQRAISAVARIEAALEQARRTGGLSAFNKAYAAQRQQARAEGWRAPPYGRCFAALRQELFKASTGVIDAGLIARALRAGS